MGGCFPCFESSNKEEEEDVEGRNGVKGGDEGNKEFGKEGSAAVNRVNSGIVTSFSFFLKVGFFSLGLFDEFENLGDVIFYAISFFYSSFIISFTWVLLLFCFCFLVF